MSECVSVEWQIVARLINIGYNGSTCRKRREKYFNSHAVKMSACVIRLYEKICGIGFPRWGAGSSHYQLVSIM